MDEKIAQLRKILDESRYTVALCGSGMMEEGGFIKVKKPERAYEVELKYGYSAEEMFSSAFYNTRPERFFEFYKKEMLENQPQKTETGPALAAMEQAGKLHCIITSNIYEHNQQAGCKNVINLHGTIYKNECPRCKKSYELSVIMNAPKVPLCEKCNVPIRPQVNLFGEMIDSQVMTRATAEVEKADVLLLVGTSLNSEVFRSYIKYFSGRWLVMIHKHEQYTDGKADLVFLNYPKEVLPKLGY